MSTLIEILTDPDWLFLRYAALIGIVISPVLGVIGTMVVTRRISSIAGASAHAALGGFGLALYLQRVWQFEWCTATLGALFGALSAAIIVGIVSLCAKEREDTVIGAVWAIGMSVGLLFLDRTPGYVDWEGYLFGDILLLSPEALPRTLLLDAIVLIPAILFYPALLAISFDGTFAQLRGLWVKTIFLVLLAMTALTIVQLINLVGIILVIALLTLPAAAAGAFTRHLNTTMILAAIFAAFFICGGLWISSIWEVPSGPAIVVLAGIVYVGSLVYKKIHCQAA